MPGQPDRTGPGFAPGGGFGVRRAAPRDYQAQSRSTFRTKRTEEYPAADPCTGAPRAHRGAVALRARRMDRREPSRSGPRPPGPKSGLLISIPQGSSSIAQPRRGEGCLASPIERASASPPSGGEGKSAGRPRGTTRRSPNPLPRRKRVEKYPGARRAGQPGIPPGAILRARRTAPQRVSRLGDLFAVSAGAWPLRANLTFPKGRRQFRHRPRREGCLASPIEGDSAPCRDGGTLTEVRRAATGDYQAQSPLTSAAEASRDHTIAPRAMAPALVSEPPGRPTGRRSYEGAGATLLRKGRIQFVTALGVRDAWPAQ